MVWRWALRGVGITLLTVWAVAWVASYFWLVNVNYTKRPREWLVAVGWGSLWIQDLDVGGASGSEWRVSHGRYDTVLRDAARKWHERSTYHLAGFAYEPPGPPIGPPQVKRWAAIPLWFPTVLCAGLLYCVWRRTGRKKHGGGFPVEVGEKKEGT
jgi:hypothetical protein